ncbi:DUF4430 domain-containing protein [Patescibacteria group bacterium]|nr:MAG: DUF4430 domain-containing protein [Patescibacteria group bacterium]
MHWRQFKCICGSEVSGFWPLIPPLCRNGNGRLRRPSPVFKYTKSPEQEILFSRQFLLGRNFFVMKGILPRPGQVRMTIGMLILLILIAIASGVWLLLAEQKDANTPLSVSPLKGERSLDASPPPDIQAPQPRRKVGDYGASLVTPPQPSSRNKFGTSSYKVEGTATSAPVVGAKMLIGGQEFIFSVPAGATVYDAMKQLADEKKIFFSGKEYAGMGFFAEEINGLQNGDGGKYWIYYVNGQQAKVGVSSYLIKSSDIISWVYENEKF